MFESGLFAYTMPGRMKTEGQGPVARMLQTNTERAKSKEKEGIHSGHFMVSRVHDNKTGDYLSDEDDDEEPDGFNFSDASKDTCTTYKFGPRSTQTLTLDASLSKLFEHLTLAYRYFLFCLHCYFISLLISVVINTVLRRRSEPKVERRSPVLVTMVVQNVRCMRLL